MCVLKHKTKKYGLKQTRAIREQKHSGVVLNIP